MINLNDINLSYILTSPEIIGLSQIDNNHRNNRFVNILYSMNYSIQPIFAHDKGVFEKNYIAICPENNDKLRKEAIFIMEQFQLNNIIIKYNGNSLLTKILSDGNEIPIEIKYYDNNETKKAYMLEGVTFTVNEMERFFFPKKKEDIKLGMKVEYFNNNQWCKKEVINVDSEYEKMYKLLMKYEKLRVCY